jgi:GNAT superfamily N-acetyltransferase
LSLFLVLNIIFHKSNFVANQCEVVKGNFDDYKKLREYHYVIGDPVCTRGIWKVRVRWPKTNMFPDPIAVIVYAVPINEWAARNVATKNYFLQWQNKSERQTMINRYITYIARIIVDPRFHRQGIASFLIAETLKLQPTCIVETMTPLDHTSGLFKKFGFRQFEQATPERYARCQNALRKVGIREDEWHLPEFVQSRIDLLSRHYHAYIHKEIKKFVKQFRHREYMYPGILRTRYLCSKIVYPNAYQIYFNPENPLPNFDCRPFFP